MKKFVLTVGIGFVAVIAVLFVVGKLRADKYHRFERVEWKNSAIRELGAVDFAKGKPPIEYTHEGWFSTEGLLMADGSWIVYRSMCHKEIPEIYDIFIGRGSDGKWYYSTYHFCIGAMTIMEDQPESLNSFVEQCALRVFDGKSDDCLLPTWPPGG